MWNMTNNILIQEEKQFLFDSCIKDNFLIVAYYRYFVNKLNVF